MTNMNKSITAIATVGVLLTIFLIFTGCDAINHESNTIKQLEERIGKLETQATQWKAANTRLQNEKAAVIVKYNKLVTINKALIAEKQDLTDRLAIAAVVIKKQDREVKTFTIKFANGEFYNKADSKTVARAVANIVKKYPVSKITVEGYSSHNGPAALNMKVSKARAEGVRDKIYEAHNDGPLHIDIVAYGEGSDNERKVVVTVETIP